MRYSKLFFLKTKDNNCNVKDSRSYNRQAFSKNMKYFFFLVGLVSLQSSLIHNRPNETNVKSNVEIKLSFDKESDTSLFNLNSKNLIHVTVCNYSDSAVFIYENWNSFGFYNFTFEIETEDSIYSLHRPKKLWYRNYPSFHTIPANDSITFDFKLLNLETASSEIYEDGWLGFPNKEFEVATIKVKYELDKENSILPIRIINSEDYLQYLDDNIFDSIPITYAEPPKKEYRDQLMLSERLISKGVPVRFKKDDE